MAEKVVGVYRLGFCFFRSGGWRQKPSSALGQKQTLLTPAFYGCFAPESGHLIAWDGRDDL